VVKKEVLTVKGTDTVEKAFHKIFEAGVLSAPIENSDGSYSGLVDMSDLLMWIVQVYCDSAEDKETLLSTLKQGSEFRKENVVNISDLSRRDPFRTTSLDDPLSSAIKVLSEGIHRLPVVDEHGKIIDVLSQMSIVTYLVQHLNGLGSLGSTHVHQIPHSSPAVKVNMHERTIDALITMVARKISAISIVNDQGFLIGTLSSSDMKNLLNIPPAHFHKTLSKDVRSFIANEHASEVDARMPGSSISPNDTFQTYLKKVAIVRIHRLWVLDSSGALLGCMSLTDALKFLASHSSS